MGKNDKALLFTIITQTRKSFLSKPETLHLTCDLIQSCILMKHCTVMSQPTSLPKQCERNNDCSYKRGKDAKLQSNTDKFNTRKICRLMK